MFILFKEWKLINEFLNYSKNPILRDYYFINNDWEYKVSIKKNEGEVYYPWIGLRAKRKGEHNIHFDFEIVTNDNIYLIMNTVVEIIKNDFKKNNNLGYSFSISSNKKGNQRAKFYEKFFKSKGLSVVLDEDSLYSNFFKIIMDK